MTETAGMSFHCRYRYGRWQLHRDNHDDRTAEGIETDSTDDPTKPPIPEREGHKCQTNTAEPRCFGDPAHKTLGVFSHGYFGPSPLLSLFLLFSDTRRRGFLGAFSAVSAV